MWALSPRPVTRITAEVTGAAYKRGMETEKQTCGGCPLCHARTFCGMLAVSRRQFEQVAEHVWLPQGAELMVEGQPVRGIWVLCQARVRLSVHAESGKQLTLREAVPGEVLGLGAVLSDTDGQVTAELIEAGHVVFVKRRDWLKLLKADPPLCLQVIQRLSEDLQRAYDSLRTLGVGRTRAARPPRPLAS